MSVVLDEIQTTKKSNKSSASTCYHCGETCPNDDLKFDVKQFCCNGCLTVYQLLNEVGLCKYYDLNNHAGKNQRQDIRDDKFAYLDEINIQQKLIKFQSNHQVHVTFHIPFIHCSSCIYLLEAFHKINSGVIRSDVNFLKKEASFVFDNTKTSLRTIVEQMAAIGYEPHISLNSMATKEKKVDRTLVYKLGVAGFCFGNIMLMSFPEYFSDSVTETAYVGNIFKYLSFAISLPSFFYAATAFFIPAWKGLKHKHLNIDAPVSLAIIVCFVRSIQDIFITGSGPGYLDSMSGIIFFMLIGRLLQAKTYGQLSFERDYTDYFPIAATKLDNNEHESSVALPDIKVNDQLLIHNQEIIPVDGILVKGTALIDYSFVTGEATPIEIDKGSIIYAGGKQLGGNMQLMAIKEVDKSYLTSLWNQDGGDKKANKEQAQHSFIHILSKYFTIIVLSIAIIAGIYWYQHDVSKAWHSITAVLIVACPCALLLTATFTNGYLLNILDKNGLFLKNAHVIEGLSKMTHLVFDKTGTLTSVKNIEASIICSEELSVAQKNALASLCKSSSHTFSQPVLKQLSDYTVFSVDAFEETPGLGVSGIINGKKYQVGLPSYFKVSYHSGAKGTILYFFEDEECIGKIVLQQCLREGMEDMLSNLFSEDMQISMLSGDGTYQEKYLKQALPADVQLYFNQQPFEKLQFIETLQSNKEYIGMIGDGLNDAGALYQSNVGICVTEDMNNFTPAADAILEAKQLPIFDRLLKLCTVSKSIIKLAFAFSILYNLIGIYFAVQGKLSPVIAAILMPCSTLTIVVMTYTLSHLKKRQLGLR